MSIYRQKRWYDADGIDNPPARGGTVAPANAPLGDASGGSRDWSRYRKAQPAEHLLPLGKTWLDALPSDVFPAALATQYARIVNLIASEWNRAGTHPAFFDELLIDRRGGRRGFPAPVKRDLEKLRDYWYTASRPLTG